MPAALASITPPFATSMPMMHSFGFGELAWAVYNAEIVLVAYAPAFSARVLGMISKASLNFWTAYWSKPGWVSANCASLWARWISHAAAPVTNLASLPIDFTTLTPSSMA